MNDIWAIILAAGESKRMGSPKMLLSFNGKTMIEIVVGNVTGSCIDNTLVVLGANSVSIIELIKGSSAKYCYNENYKDGMLSSVKTGFNNLPSDYDAVLVFQGDQPFITPKVINTLIDKYRRSDKGIVIPVYKKKRGHPILISNRYREDVIKTASDEGLCSLAHNFPDDVLEIETEEPGILKDFDTHEDYINEINQIQ
jgi:molybdenum cofactor cytidylyltransferase